VLVSAGVEDAHDDRGSVLVQAVLEVVAKQRDGSAAFVGIVDPGTAVPAVPVQTDGGDLVTGWQAKPGDRRPFAAVERVVS